MQFYLSFEISTVVDVIVSGYGRLISEETQKIRLSIRLDIPQYWD